MPQERKKTAKQSVSITLDKDLVKAIKCLAAENERSLSQYINLVLKSHLATHAIERPVISKLPADQGNVPN